MDRMLRRRRAVVAVAGVLAVSQAACYDYLAMPAAGAPRPADLPVRVTLLAGGTARVAEALGPYQVMLDGTLQGDWPGDSLRLRVFASRHEAGYRADHPTGPLVVLAASDVQGVLRRKLNPIKTGLLGTVLAVGIGSLPTVVQRAGGGGGRSSEPPPSPP